MSFLDRCEWALTLVATAAAFVMMMLTTVDATGRYLFNRPILVAFELTTNYLMIAAIFLAMPYAYRQGANIRVTFVVERLGRGPRVLIDHAVQLVSIVYCGLLVYATFAQARLMFTTGTQFTTVEVPIWPAHVAVSVGLFFTALFMLLDLPKVRQRRSPLFADG